MEELLAEEEKDKGKADKGKGGGKEAKEAKKKKAKKGKKEKKKAEPARVQYESEGDADADNVRACTLSSPPPSAPPQLRHGRLVGWVFPCAQQGPLRHLKASAG